MLAPPGQAPVESTGPPTAMVYLHCSHPSYHHPSLVHIEPNDPTTTLLCLVISACPSITITRPALIPINRTTNYCGKPALPLFRSSSSQCSHHRSSSHHLSLVHIVPSSLTTISFSSVIFIYPAIQNQHHIASAEPPTISTNPQHYRSSIPFIAHTTPSLPAHQSLHLN